MINISRLLCWILLVDGRFRIGYNRRYEQVTSIYLDPSNICGQAYDGASVMSSGKEVVQAKIKEISPLALFTHCYAHCLNLSIAATCQLSEV